MTEQMFVLLATITMVA